MAIARPLGEIAIVAVGILIAFALEAYSRLHATSRGASSWPCAGL